MEYVMYGKLLTHLREQRSKQTSLFHFTEEDLQTPSEESTITAKDLTKYAYGVAKGMEYITSKQVNINLTNFEFHQSIEQKEYLNNTLSQFWGF